MERLDHSLVIQGCPALSVKSEMDLLALRFIQGISKGSLRVITLTQKFWKQSILDSARR